MKGIVFTEFLAFVAGFWDENMVDDLIEASALPSRGAYTSVGTYDHREMVSLLLALSERSQLSPDDLMQRFGFYLSDRFALLFPAFFSRSDSFFTFLASIDDYIHVEVKKLYPDAELPSFDVVKIEGAVMTMRYRSSRKMEAFAEGLILGSARHFGCKILIERTEEEDGSILFVVTEMQA
jgi:Haem-NO-binding